MKIKPEFMSLLKQFVQRELSSDDFKGLYLELRRRALDESDLDPILRANILTLKEKRLAEEISSEDFSSQFQQLVTKLWHDRDIQPFSREARILLEELLYAVEALHAPIHPTYGGESIDENQLHTIVKSVLEELTSMEKQN